MKPITYLKLCTIVFLLSIVLQGCKKENTTPGTTTTTTPAVKYEIILTGKKFVGETIEFTTNVPENISVQWQLYIDTKTGTKNLEFNSRAFSYTFTEIGSYSVTLILYGDRANKNNSNLHTSFYIKHPFKASDIYKMQGIRKCDVVVDSAILLSEKRDTVNTYKDNIEVNVINEKLIVVKGDTLKLGEGQEEIGIEDQYLFIKEVAEEYAWNSLRYYPKEDSIVHSVHLPQGGKQIGKSEHHIFGITTSYYSVK